jgi:ankyrin repeat protein
MKRTLCLALSALIAVGLILLLQYKHEKHLLNHRLLQAVEMGDSAEVVHLLAQGVNIETRNAEELTPLAIAIRRGDVSLVKVLLMHGGNVHATTEKAGNFPPRDIILVPAAEKGYTQIVQLLLDRGADINTRSGMGVTALMLATQRNHIDVVKLLITQGADVNAKDDRGFTALSFAKDSRKTNSDQIVQMLEHAMAKE